MSMRLYGGSDSSLFNHENWLETSDEHTSKSQGPKNNNIMLEKSQTEVAVLSATRGSCKYSILDLHHI